MPSTQPLLDALRDKLATDLVSQLANRIHDTEGPVDSVLPMLVYRVQKQPVDGYFDGPDRMNIFLSIEITSSRKSGARALRLIHDAAYESLHRQSLTVVGVHNAQALCLDRDGSIDIHDDTMVITSSWNIFADPD